MVPVIELCIGLANVVRKRESAKVREESMFKLKLCRVLCVCPFKSFVLLGDGKELYHHSPSGILQRCISIAEGQALLQEIHSGACGHHAAPRALVGNAFRQGFYWPTAVADATGIVRTCEWCQFYARQTHLPAQALQTIPIT